MLQLFWPVLSFSTKTSNLKQSGVTNCYTQIQINHLCNNPYINALEYINHRKAVPKSFSTIELHQFGIKATKALSNPDFENLPKNQHLKPLLQVKFSMQRYSMLHKLLYSVTVF